MNIIVVYIHWLLLYPFVFKTIQNSVKLQLYIFFPSYYYSFPENVDNNGSRYIVSTSQNVKLPCNFMQFSKNSSLQTVPRDEKLFKLEVKCMQSCNCCIVTSGQKPFSKHQPSLSNKACISARVTNFCHSSSFYLTLVTGGQYRLSIHYVNINWLNNVLERPAGTRVD